MTTSTVKVVKVNNLDDYDWSINITQGIIAFIEGLLVGMKAPKSAVLSIIIVASSIIPPSYNTGYAYNEKLWEAVFATVIGGLALHGIYGGSFIANAFHAFLIDTSSAAVTSAVYDSYILNGNNVSVSTQREQYPEASLLNRVTLG